MPLNWPTRDAIAPYRLLALRLGGVVILLTACATGVGLALLRGRAGEAVPPVDEWARSWTLNHLTRFTHEAGIVGAVVATAVVFVAAFLVSVLIWVRTRDPARALLPFLAVAIADLSCAMTKVLVARARPGGHPQLGFLHNFAFPSGHSVSVTALVTSVLLVISWGRGFTPLTAITVVCVVPIVAVVMVSRLVLDVHWATDVVFGLAVGIGASLLAHRAIRISFTPVVGPSPSKTSAATGRAKGPAHDIGRERGLGEASL